jgi:hypothetical protein
MLFPVVKRPYVQDLGRAGTETDGLGAELADNPWLVGFQLGLKGLRDRVWFKGSNESAQQHLFSLYDQSSRLRFFLEEIANR